MHGECRVRMKGPLAGEARGLWNDLRELGYAPGSRISSVRLLVHLSVWMQQRRLKPGQLTSARFSAFVRERRRQGRRVQGVRLVLWRLRHVGLVRAGDPSTSRRKRRATRLLADYEGYLRKERAASPSTLRAYRRVAAQFLDRAFGRGRRGLKLLTVRGVCGFVLETANARCVATTKCVVTALRSLLRYLHVRGELSTDLAGAVPTVAGGQLGPLPRALKPEQVRRLLQACNRRTHQGRRDLAIVTMLARMGLRAGEVCALMLEDIDWGRGEMVVRGKGGNESRLPIPVDVGQALAAYLRQRRPPTASRHLLLRMRAPFSALTSAAVAQTVRRLCDRAGVQHASPHRLRHTAATRMLAEGASLSDIAQVLRHRSETTTASYARVDSCSLKALAQPWPGAMP